LLTREKKCRKRGGLPLRIGGSKSGTLTPSTEKREVEAVGCSGGVYTRGEQRGGKKSSAIKKKKGGYTRENLLKGGRGPKVLQERGKKKSGKREAGGEKKKKKKPGVGGGPVRKNCTGLTRGGGGKLGAEKKAVN